MPESEVKKLVKFSALKSLANRTATAIAPAIKYVSASGNVISFFTSTDGSGTAAFTVELVKEQFLDQAHTTLVHNFAFSAATYPGATDPELNGKSVFVLAVKGKDATGGGTDTVSYSFVDFTKFIDIYTAKAGDSAKILNINGYEIEFKISSVANNALEVKNDGLYVDISGKADKDVDAVEGNFAIFDANGNPIDSGYGLATDAEIEAMLDEAFGVSQSNGE